MKETPNEIKIHNNMKAGVLSIHGFLGDDDRHFSDIITEDKHILDKVDLTTEMIADRLQYFTDKAFIHYDGTVEIDEKYVVEYRSFRGKIICPFRHGGGFRKGEVTLTNKINGLSLCWTPLNIHMIRDHCFFEGKGSKHRIDPKTIKEIIF